MRRALGSAGNRKKERGFRSPKSAERAQASVSLRARGVAGKPTRFDPAAIVQYLPDDAGAVGGNLVEELHRFDEADNRGRRDLGAHLDERLGAGSGGGVEGSDRLALDVDQNRTALRELLPGEQEDDSDALLLSQHSG